MEFTFINESKVIDSNYKVLVRQHALGYGYQDNYDLDTVRKGVLDWSGLESKKIDKILTDLLVNMTKFGAV